MPSNKDSEVPYYLKADPATRYWGARCVDFYAILKGHVVKCYFGLFWRLLRMRRLFSNL